MMKLDYAPRDFADWREIPSEALERKESGSGWLRRWHARPEISRSLMLRDMEHLNIQETAEALGILSLQ